MHEVVGGLDVRERPRDGEQSLEGGRVILAVVKAAQSPPGFLADLVEGRVEGGDGCGQFIPRVFHPAVEGVDVVAVDEPDSGLGEGQARLFPVGQYLRPDGGDGPKGGVLGGRWAFTSVVVVLVLQSVGVQAHSPMDHHWSP